MHSARYALIKRSKTKMPTLYLGLEPEYHWLVSSPPTRITHLVNTEASNSYVHTYVYTRYTILLSINLFFSTSQHSHKSK